MRRVGDVRSETAASGFIGRDHDLTVFEIRVHEELKLDRLLAHVRFDDREVLAIYGVSCLDEAVVVESTAELEPDKCAERLCPSQDDFVHPWEEGSVVGPGYQLVRVPDEPLHEPKLLQHLAAQEGRDPQEHET